MTDMAEEQAPAAEPAGAPGADGPGWRTGVSGWVLVVGLIVFGAAGLALASIGHPVGILAVAVLEAGAIALLYSWVSSTAPR